MDDLARIVQEGFLDMGNRIGGVESKIVGLESRIGGLESKIGGLESRMETLETDVKGIKSTVENIEAELNKKVDKTEHNTLKYRVEKLEKKFA